MSGRFEFQEPLWLILLGIVPFLAWLGGRLPGRASIGFPSLRVLGSLGRKVTEKPSRFRFPLTLLALVPAIFSMARPVWTGSETTREASGIDLMIALDTSASMDTPDFFEQDADLRRAVTRLDASKKILSGFIEGRPDDRLGLISFATRPYILTPLTLHHTHLQGKLETLRPETEKSARTAIGSALASAATQLDQRGAKSKVVILVTDGDNNAGPLSPREAAELATTLGVKIYPVALSAEAAPLLRDLAKTSDGEFHQATSFDSLREAFSSIDKLEKSAATATIRSEDRPLHLYLLGLALILTALALAKRSLNPGPLP